MKLNPQEVKLSKEDLAAIQPAIGQNGAELFYFDEYVYSPPGSFGLISLNKTYKKVFAQDRGVDVPIQIEVLGVTKIDSFEKVVGLELSIHLEWEDNRVIWEFGGPKLNQEFEFNTKVLR